MTPFNTVSSLRSRLRCLAQDMQRGLVFGFLFWFRIMKGLPSSEASTWGLWFRILCPTSGRSLLKRSSVDISAS